MEVSGVAKSKTESRKKTTLWNFLFLNFKFVISLVNGILIIPLYLHYIDSSLYGAWLATGNVLTWITIVDPGVSGVILQRVAFAIGKDDKKEVGQSITAGILISLILFFISLAVGYGLSFFITDVAKIKEVYRADIISSFRIALWGTALSLLADTFRNIVLAFQKTRQHGFFLTAVLIASILVNIVLLVMGYGVYALAYTSLFRGAATLAFAVILSFSLIKKGHIKLHIELPYFKSFSKVFAFTFSSRLVETVASNIDLILVSRYIGSQAVTVLDLSRRPLKIVTGLANNVSIAMLPSLPHLFGSGKIDTIRTTTLRIWNIILWMSGFIVGGFILFNYNLLDLWVGKKFWVGDLNNIIICMSFFFLAIGYNLSNVTHSMGDMRNNSIINVVRSSIYIVLLFVLAKYFGMIGVLLAFLLPLFIMLWYYPRRVCIGTNFTKENIKSAINENVLMLIILSICILFSFFLRSHLSWAVVITLCVAYTIVFSLILLFFSKNFKAEWNTALSMVRKKLGK